MNRYLQDSIEYASQRSYLDDLYRVYPVRSNGLRDINEQAWAQVVKAFKAQNNARLVSALLKLDLFPFKDSYVAYLRRDPSALSRNPQTINRLAGVAYELGLVELYKQSSVPKESNRQMGASFREWVSRGVLGLQPVSLEAFTSTTENAILDASDAAMQQFAQEHLGYTRSKGLDFLARFNGKYVIGEAKFLTDFGGHQNAQFEDAMATLTTKRTRAVHVAILDGVLYIPSRNKMYRAITTTYARCNIMSALLLREFLYQV